jgi:hypothetical protein
LSCIERLRRLLAGEAVVRLSLQKQKTPSLAAAPITTASEKAPAAGEARKLQEKTHSANDDAAIPQDFGRLIQLFS